MRRGLGSARRNRSAATSLKRSRDAEVFTGIVTDQGEVIAVDPRADDLRRLTIACRYDRAGIAEGASIACNGVCLTVVGTSAAESRTTFSADAAAETLAVTTARNWRR